MDNNTCVKAILIRSYSEISYLVESDSFDFYDETVTNEWVLDIFNFIDAMSIIILLEKGYTMDFSMRFSYLNGNRSSSVAEILSEVDGIVPTFIQKAINEVYKMYKRINMVGIEDDTEFRPALELHNLLLKIRLSKAVQWIRCRLKIIRYHR